MYHISSIKNALLNNLNSKVKNPVILMILVTTERQASLPPLAKLARQTSIIIVEVTPNIMYLHNHGIIDMAAVVLVVTKDNRIDRIRITTSTDTKKLSPRKRNSFLGDLLSDYFSVTFVFVVSNSALAVAVHVPEQSLQFSAFVQVLKHDALHQSVQPVPHSTKHAMSQLLLQPDSVIVRPPYS